jgi:hypothetical protein
MDKGHCDEDFGSGTPDAAHAAVNLFGCRYVLRLGEYLVAQFSPNVQRVVIERMNDKSRSLERLLIPFAD